LALLAFMCWCAVRQSINQSISFNKAKCLYPIHVKIPVNFPGCCVCIIWRSADRADGGRESQRRHQVTREENHLAFGTRAAETRSSVAVKRRAAVGERHGCVHAAELIRTAQLVGILCRQDECSSNGLWSVKCSVSSGALLAVLHGAVCTWTMRNKSRCFC